MGKRKIIALMAAMVLAITGCMGAFAEGASQEGAQFAAFQSAGRNYVAVQTDGADGYAFTVNGQAVEPVAVTTDGSVVRLPVEGSGEVSVVADKDGQSVGSVLTVSEADGAPTVSDGYLYGVSAMSFADFWYGELEDVASPGATFDLANPDETTTSAEYLAYSDGSTKGEDSYVGVQKNTYDNDSGMYDAVTRATVGYGVYRASFAHTVELTRDDKTTEVYNNEIVVDPEAPTGYRVDENTTGAEGVVLSSNTRIDTENSQNYTPDTTTTFEESVAAGGAGYTITGLKRVTVKVDAEALANAAALDALGLGNVQTQAFLAKAEQIHFDDSITAQSAYAVKELLPNGIYGAREVNESAEAMDPGAAWIGDGSNGSKAVANNDGYTDVTVYVYFDQYGGYTRGSIANLTEETLDTLYADSEGATTYAENKEAGDKPPRSCTTRSTSRAPSSSGPAPTPRSIRRTTCSAATCCTRIPTSLSTTATTSRSPLPGTSRALRSWATAITASRSLPTGIRTQSWRRAT